MNTLNPLSSILADPFWYECLQPVPAFGFCAIVHYDEETTEGKQRYKLEGECYVHGMMDGR